MRKIRTDTVMGEDLEKIFRKLNRTVKHEEAKNLEDQKIILKKQFENLRKKKQMQTILLLLCVILVAIFYYTLKY